MNRRPLLRSGLGLAVGFVGAFAVIQAVEWLGPSDSGTEMVLGVPDLGGYCADGDDVLLAMLVSPDPYGWECAGPVSNVWTSTVLDIDAVCRWQYDDTARAKLVDPERPEGWRCVTDA